MQQLAVPSEHGLEDRLAVDGVVRGLADADVVERLGRGIERERNQPCALQRQQLEVAGLQLRELGDRRRHDDLDAARLQLGGAGGRVGDRS